MELENNSGLFNGSIKKILWNASVIHEKRLGVLDEHIEKILEKSENNKDYKKELALLNKKIDILANFRNEFNEYKKDIKNIKNTIALQDSGDLNEKIEEINNTKLSTVIYLNNIKEMRKTIKVLKNKLNKLSNDYNILNLSHEQLKLNCDYNNSEINKSENVDKSETKNAAKIAAKTALLAKNYSSQNSKKIDKLLTGIVEETTTNSENIKLKINDENEITKINVETKDEKKKKKKIKPDTTRPSWLNYKVKKKMNEEKNN